MRDDKPSLDAVLPICVSGFRKGSELARSGLLLRTLNAFVEPDLIRRLLVVTPHADRAVVERYIRPRTQLNVCFMSDEDFHPHPPSGLEQGSSPMQMVVKLAASAQSNAEFVLTLDADVVCTAPLTRDTLLPGGRAVIQPESKQIHPDWWLHSARILGLDPAMTSPGMSVTPALLSSDVCRSLVQRLEGVSLFGHTWIEHLLWLKGLQPHILGRLWNLRYWWHRRAWTEYSLYFIALQANANPERYHVMAGSPLAPFSLVSPGSIWSRHDLGAEAPASPVLSDKNALFCVFQSTAGLDTRALEQMIESTLLNDSRQSSRTASPGPRKNVSLGVAETAPALPARRPQSSLS